MKQELFEKATKIQTELKNLRIERSELLKKLENTFQVNIGYDERYNKKIRNIKIGLYKEIKELVNNDFNYRIKELEKEFEQL